MKIKFDFSKLIISFFYVGFISKKIPGTVGSLLATFIVVLMYLSGTTFFLLFLTILFFLLGIVCSHFYLIIKKKDSNPDPGYIIIDEVCGIFCGCYILNCFGLLSISTILFNFVLFRILDIWKPFPIRNVERILEKKTNTIALGIMIDDILASLVATYLQVAMMCFWQ
jgi:phosphatidylglycerophosphatase A